MKLYRFSPIKSEAELIEAVNYLHKACHGLCLRSFGKYLPVRGIVGVFAHYDKEFEFLTSLRKQLTNSEVNYKGKYFKLYKPITVAEQGSVPSATYEFLYIRRVDPYRPQVGDIDFVLPVKDHEQLKSKLNLDTFVDGARRFGRPEENIIELWDPDVDAAAYVATTRMRDELKSGSA